MNEAQTTFLTSLPLELVADILKYLPINDHLVEVGLVSKRHFAPLIFSDLPHARNHLRYQYRLSRYPIVRVYLEKTAIKADWSTLSITFRAAVYELLQIQTSYWSIPSDSNLSATKTVHCLLRNGFDPSLNNTWILTWACFHGYNDAVELLLKHPKVEPKDLALCAAVKENHLSTVQILLSNPQITSNPKTINNGIKAAAESNRVDMMRLLLAVPCAEPSHNNSYPLHYSSNCKNLEMIKLLLEDGRADPMAFDGIALIYALRSKTTKEIVQVLLKDPRMDPSMKDNLCIRKAAEFGWTDIVETLLEDERVDPSVSLNWPLRCAIKSGNLELVKCIWGHPRTVVPAMKIPHWIVSAKARKFYDIVEFLSGKL